ncbi:hypothetical protein VCV18_002936 [Metarhizium anisopliae]
MAVREACRIDEPPFWLSSNARQPTKSSQPPLDRWWPGGTPKASFAPRGPLTLNHHRGTGMSGWDA